MPNAWIWLVKATAHIPLRCGYSSRNIARRDFILSERSLSIAGHCVCLASSATSFTSGRLLKGVCVFWGAISLAKPKTMPYTTWE